MRSTFYFFVFAACVIVCATQNSSVQTVSEPIVTNSIKTRGKNSPCKNTKTFRVGPSNNNNYDTIADALLDVEVDCIEGHIFDLEINKDHPMPSELVRIRNVHFRGDMREIVGFGFVNGLMDTILGGILNIEVSERAGSGAISMTHASGTITVNRSESDPDFSEVMNGDEIRIVDADGVVTTHSALYGLDNVIVLTSWVGVPPFVNGVGFSIVPRTSISGGSTIMSSSDLTFSGLVNDVGLCVYMNSKVRVDRCMLNGAQVVTAQSRFAAFEGNTFFGPIVNGPTGQLNLFYNAFFGLTAGLRCESSVSYVPTCVFTGNDIAIKAQNGGNVYADLVEVFNAQSVAIESTSGATINCQTMHVNSPLAVAFKASHGAKIVSELLGAFPPPLIGKPIITAAYRLAVIDFDSTLYLEDFADSDIAGAVSDNIKLIVDTTDYVGGTALSDANSDSMAGTFGMRHSYYSHAPL